MYYVSEFSTTIVRSKILRNLCITVVDGHTGFTITELLLTNNDFKKGIAP